MWSGINSTCLPSTFRILAFIYFQENLWEKLREKLRERSFGAVYGNLLGKFQASSNARDFAKISSSVCAVTTPIFLSLRAR